MRGQRDGVLAYRQGALGGMGMGAWRSGEGGGEAPEKRGIATVVSSSSLNLAQLWKEVKERGHAVLGWPRSSFGLGQQTFKDNCKVMYLITIKIL